jgi:Glycosyltransferase GT-D fold
LTKILTETETLRRAIAGESLARYGDGELRLALGSGTSPTQVKDPKLSEELRTILKSPPKGCLVCLPNFTDGPNAANWASYAAPRFAAMYGPGTYGSAFISRPDNAPHIDTPEYWTGIERLWAGQDIIFVSGTERSLRLADFASATSVLEVHAPRRDAYAHIDRLEAEIASEAEGRRVILCLGATATVLAARLARRGIHALDLGHIGMFRRHAGAYRYTLDDLSSPRYRKMLEEMHQRKDWGRDAKKHSAAVRAYAEALGATAILDYGCGKEALAKSLPDLKVMGFDVGIPEKRALPKPADLVVCLDVLEHIEPKKLDNVLDHLVRLAGKGLYLVIATRPANASLPDGKQAHLLVKPAEWWRNRILQLDVEEEHHEIIGNHEVRLWLRKPQG